MDGKLTKEKESIRSVNKEVVIKKIDSIIKQALEEGQYYTSELLEDLKDFVIKNI